MAGKGFRDTFLINVPVADVILHTIPVGADVGLLVIPDGFNESVELLSIAIAANQLVVDGSNVATLDIEFHDDSANSDANLVAAFNLLAAGGNTVLEGTTIWQGSQIMDPGDRLNAEFTLTTPDTAGLGYHFTLECRIVSRSGD